MQQETMIKESRIEYIDVFKGILILLVVLGHTTSKFNLYIYQFHMAGFFFISGWLSNVEKYSSSVYIFRKTKSILIPLFMVTILTQFLMQILHYKGYYNFILPDNLPFYPFSFVVKEFFWTNMYVWFLGATWFMFVLFFIEVLQALLYKSFLSNQKKIIMVSFFLYIMGYFCIRRGFFRFMSLDLVLIAQFYYIVGYLLKKRNILFSDVKERACFFIILNTTLLVFLIGTVPNVTVDYPSRQFGNPIFNAVVALNGVICIYFWSTYLSTIKSISLILGYLGRNTLGILFFHFMFFKVSFFVLYVTGIIDKSYFKNFLPGEDLYNYTVVIIVSSIGCSLIFWKILNKIPILRFLLGTKR